MSELDDADTEDGPPDRLKERKAEEPPPAAGATNLSSAKTLVRRGWDRASWAYRPDPSGPDAFNHDLRELNSWLKPLGESIPPGKTVVDLGCGCGTALLVLTPRYRVVGVDLSRVQIRRARLAVPDADLVRGDMTQVAFGERSVDAVVCLYSLIHVPLTEQFGVLGRVRRWLRPGGGFLVITGHAPYEGVQSDWLGSGAPMFWSHADATTYRSWLERAGFEILDQRPVAERPAEGTVYHELFWARAR